MKNIGKPTILIVNGVSFVGRALARALLDQGGEVAILGEYNDAAREFVQEFKGDSLKFLDNSLTGELAARLPRLDYVVALLNDLPQVEYKTTDFVRLISQISGVLDTAHAKSAMVALVTSMRWEEELKKRWPSSDAAYGREDIEMFSEKTVREYISKTGLDARIIRLGEVYGKGMDVNKDILFCAIIKQALEQEEIVVPGETLQFDYYIHVLDGVFGILKALFANETSGNTYTLANPEEISLLSLAHKVIETGVVAKRVRFEKENGAEEEPLYKNTYSLAPNLEKLGWMPKISFERGLAQTVDYFREVTGRGKSRKHEESRVSNNGDEIALSFKMEEAIPVEMSKERERFERIQRLKKAKEQREATERFRKALIYSAWTTLCALFALFYVFVVVPVAGVTRSYLKLGTLTREYVELQSSRDEARLEKLTKDTDKQVELLEMYISRLDYLVKSVGVEDSVIRVLNLMYGTREFMEGVVLMEDNSVAASVSLRSAKLWLDNSDCLEVKRDFCQPFDEIKKMNSELLEQ